MYLYDLEMTQNKPVSVAAVSLRNQRPLRPYSTHKQCGLPVVLTECTALSSWTPPDSGLAYKCTQDSRSIEAT